MEWINFIRRNLVSISFPTLAATLIYFDWNHTRLWKSQKKN